MVKKPVEEVEENIMELKEEKVVENVSNKMMPTPTKKTSTVVVQNTVLHKGVIYRKGQSYDVDCETKKSINTYLTKSTQGCNCK